MVLWFYNEELSSRDYIGIVKINSIVGFFEDVFSLNNLTIDLGSCEINPESFDELDNLVKLMKENPDVIIQLEGHTDFRGGKSKNQRLSEDRVKEVKNYLILGGIMPDRILTKAYGGSKPLSWESSEEASRLNRRVEVRIIKD